MGNNICLIYNYAQHYRSSIFSLMDKELPIDFYFGNKYLDVKKMDYSLLSNFKRELKNIKFIFNPLTYQIGAVSLLREDYITYIMLGDLHSISTWAVLFLSKFSNKKIYLWSHGWYGRESRLKRVIKKKFFGMADGVFLYGNYAKNLMREEGFNENQLFVIHNSLSYDVQLEIRNNLNESSILKDYFKNDNENLIFIGRLTPEKDLGMVLRAIYELKRKGKYLNLVIVGTGRMESELKLLTKEFNIQDNVWFYGASYDEELLANLIYNSSLCISPGNVGLTAIHSMMFGTPVVSHNNFAFQMPEFEAIKYNKTGAFFEQNCLESLVKVIEDWFANGISREEIRKNCYREIDEKWNIHYQLKVIKDNLKY